ncbi:MAG: Holliday junction resolvase RuvX [Dehalococcoidia bacterium]|jgi:putative Holliday junction resolvase
MAIIGLDVGDKHIGVAMSIGTIAIPVAVIKRTEEEEDMERIAALTSDYDTEMIVIGLPRSMDGSIGAQAELVIDFAKSLSDYIDIPIDMCDERLTTVTADQLLRESGAKRKQRKANIDAMAAAVILQAYLDGKNR